MSAPTHQHTARWLMALANALGPRERKFVGSMCRIKHPSPKQREYLERLAQRVQRCAGRALTDA